MIERHHGAIVTITAPADRPPNDVAAATLFLASDVSSWITGIALDIAGGKIML